MFIAFVMVLAFGLPPLFRQPEQPVPTLFPTSTATGTSIPIPDSTVSLTETLAPSSTPTEYVNATTAPLPTEIIDAKGVSMVLVPEGEFYFGEKDAESEVFLPSFYIDTYEVTNSRYAQCVSDGGCEPPAETVLATYNYYGNPQFNDYPVVWVNITMAEEYCNWRDIRLPTEFEWEKAARGTDKRIYPWGNANDVTNLANGHGSKDGYIISSPVGAFPNGVSPYGVYDMSGNVWEWTSAITSFGGSWVYGDLYVYDRSNIGGGARFDVGFRCANDALNITSTITVDMTQTPESPASGFELIAIDKVAYRGGEASAQVKTQPGSDCALGFILPSGTLSQVGGTGPATADENGYCSWTWNVASNVNPGWGSIYIEAGGDSATYPIEIK